MAARTWTKFTKFPGVPDQTYVSRVVASRFREGTVYATIDNHRNNDFKPYVAEEHGLRRTLERDHRRICRRTDRCR